MLQALLPAVASVIPVEKVVETPLDESESLVDDHMREQVLWEIVSSMYSTSTCRIIQRYLEDPDISVRHFFRNPLTLYGGNWWVLLPCPKRDYCKWIWFENFEPTELLVVHPVGTTPVSYWEKYSRFLNGFERAFENLRMRELANALEHELLALLPISIRFRLCSLLKLEELKLKGRFKSQLTPRKGLLHSTNGSLRWWSLEYGELLQLDLDFYTELARLYRYSIELPLLEKLPEITAYEILTTLENGGTLSYWYPEIFASLRGEYNALVHNQQDYISLLIGYCKVETWGKKRRKMGN